MKPKFNIQDYEGKYAIRIHTKEQACVFNDYFKGLRDYRVRGTFDFMDEYLDWSFDLRDDCHSLTNWYRNHGYTIIDFEDFDWSDFMKKEFTKKDLKNGDVVKYRNGRVGIVILETGTVILENDDYMGVDDICDDLTDKGAVYPVNSKGWDIVAVRRPTLPCECRFCAFDHEWGKLVYERKEVEEMTLEEVCKALGKEIKIVKK